MDLDQWLWEQDARSHYYFEDPRAEEARIEGLNAQAEMEEEYLWEFQEAHRLLWEERKDDSRKGAESWDFRFPEWDDVPF